MNKEYIEMLKGALGDPANLTPGVLQAFLEITLKQVSTLQQKINSIDPKERENGLNAAVELRHALEEQMESISKMVGVSPDELGALTDDLITAETPERAMLETAKEQFQNVKNPTPSKKKMKRNNKINLVG